MESIVDDLFGELVGQVKEMLSQGKEITQSGEDLKPVVTKQSHIESHPPKAKFPKSKSPSKSVFAFKSTPSTTLSQPVRGIKRPFESTTPQVMATSSAPSILNTLTTDTETWSLSSKKQVIDLKGDNQPETDTQVSGSLVEKCNTPVNVDKDQAKFACQSPGCGKRFKKSSHLKDHERTHSNLKPFVCQYPDCTYANATRSNTIAHIRKAHLKASADDDPGEVKEPTEYLLVKQELLK